MVHGLLDTNAQEHACNCPEMMQPQQQQHTWGRSQELVLAEVLQKQPLRSERCLPCAPTLQQQQSICSSTASYTSLLTHTEHRVYNLSLFPILKGLSWLKEIYNQGDDPQDSTNSWRQNYWLRARKHLLELLQILIFFLNNFAKQ